MYISAIRNSIQNSVYVAVHTGCTFQIQRTCCACACIRMRHAVFNVISWLLQFASNSHVVFRDTYMRTRCWMLGCHNDHARISRMYVRHFRHSCGNDTNQCRTSGIVFLGYNLRLDSFLFGGHTHERMRKTYHTIVSSHVLVMWRLSMRCFALHYFALLALLCFEFHLI